MLLCPYSNGFKSQCDEGQALLNSEQPNYFWLNTAHYCTVEPWDLNRTRHCNDNKCTMHQQSWFKPQEVQKVDKHLRVCKFNTSVSAKTSGLVEKSMHPWCEELRVSWWQVHEWGESTVKHNDYVRQVRWQSVPCSGSAMPCVEQRCVLLMQLVSRVC